MSLADLLNLVPGLYVLALGGLLVAALKRWYDPLPGLVQAVSVAVAVVFFAPVLLGGRTFLPVDALRAAAPFDRLEAPSPPGNPLRGDLMLHDAPALAAVRHALHRGEWPLWNPDAGAGMPLLATPEAQLLSPPVAASLPLGLDRAAGVAAALAVGVALAFTFLLLRREGAGAAPALVGALAYALGGHLQLWLGWPRANAAAFLPALLYAVALCVDRGARRDFALLAAAAFAVVTAGDGGDLLGGNAAGYALLTALAFLVVRLHRRAPAARLRPFFAQLAAVALAAAAAAPVLLPAADWAPNTAQAEALATRSRNELQFDVLGLRSFGDPAGRRSVLAAAGNRVLALIAPGAFGNDRFGAYWGPGNVVEDAAGFAGTSVVVLALLGAAAALRRRPARGPALAAAAGGGLASERLFVALAAVCLAVAAWPAGLAPLLDRLPLLGPAADHHRRMTLVLNLALAYLAAAALTRLEGRRQRSARTAAAIAAVAVAAVAVGAAVTAAYLAHPAPAGTPGDLVALRGRWLALQLAAAAGTAIVLAAALRPRADGRGGTGAAWRWPALSVAGLVALELAVFHVPFHPAGPQRLFFPAAAPLSFLAAAVAADPQARISGMGPALLPETATVYRLPDTRIGTVSRPYAYDLLVAPLFAAQGRERPLFVHPLRPIHDLLGVRYLLAPPDLELGPPLVLRMADPAGRVYERPHPLPRLFLPRSAIIFHGGAWEEQVAAIADFAAVALVQPSPGRDDDWTADGGGSGSEVAVTRLEAARVAARTTLAEERLLATSIYQDGGWRLLADGRPTPTLLANGPLVAAWMPAGAHRLELLYRPGPFVVGMLLAALALAAGCAWLARPGR